MNESKDYQIIDYRFNQKAIPQSFKELMRTNRTEVMSQDLNLEKDSLGDPCYVVGVFASKNPKVKFDVFLMGGLQEWVAFNEKNNQKEVFSRGKDSTMRSGIGSIGQSSAITDQDVNWMRYKIRNYNYAIDNNFYFKLKPKLECRFELKGMEEGFLVSEQHPFIVSVDFEHKYTDKYEGIITIEQFKNLCVIFDQGCVAIREKDLREEFKKQWVTGKNSKVFTEEDIEKYSLSERWALPQTKNIVLPEIVRKAFLENRKKYDLFCRKYPKAMIAVKLPLGC